MSTVATHITRRSWYDRLHATVKGNAMLKGAAALAVRSVPDLTVTRNVAHVGRLSFGLRRHHWLIGRDCFKGHRRTLGLFAHVIRDGDVLYDAGANIGYYARFVLANFPVSKLIAFEPMAANVRLLRRNQALLDNPDHMRIYPLALSDRAGEAALQVDDMSDGSAVLDEVSGGEASGGRAARGLRPKTEKVRIQRLDVLIAEDHLPPPDVIKIDTEGAEDLVLGGAIETLRQHRPRLILAMHGTDRAERVLKLLGDLGYHAAGWMRDRSAADGFRWARLHPEQAEEMADNNCIASAEEADVDSPAPVLSLAVQ